MQQIFYNANVLTINSAFDSAEAILTNDETIVFVGSNEEVLKMKTNEITLVDLNGKTIIPSLFCTEIKIYETIEQRLKNANLVNFIENYDKNDENYEKFDNFEVYKNEFLNIQDELIKMGITTVQELGINQIQFAFWKKLSETNLIKIDVIGYVDLLQAKDVMDNNCRSYRKYKNHFRLGGYYLALDGKLLAKKAWLNKPYKFEHKYVGYSSVLSEQFEMLFKTALEEKHQLIVEANGDRAIEQYIEIVNESLRETFGRSIVTTFTTLIPVVILIFLGSHEILNFNIALLFGLISGVYSSLFIASQLWLDLDYRHNLKNQKKPKKKTPKKEDEEILIKGINA